MFCSNVKQSIPVVSELSCFFQLLYLMKLLKGTFDAQFKSTATSCGSRLIDPHGIHGAKAADNPKPSLES